MNGNLTDFLSSTAVIRLDGKVFTAFVEKAVKGAESAEEKARSLFLTVREGIIYDPFVPSFKPENYYPENILKAGRGYCVMKAALLCAAFRRVGIPSRLGFADLRILTTPAEMVQMLGCDIFTWHGYAEAFINGQWLKATPSFHSELCRKKDIAPLEFDAKSHCVFPACNLSGEPFASYIRYHGSFTDLPLDLIMKGWREVYTNARVDMWMEALAAKS